MVSSAATVTSRPPAVTTRIRTGVCDCPSYVVRCVAKEGDGSRPRIPPRSARGDDPRPRPRFHLHAVRFVRFVTIALRLPGGARHLRPARLGSPGLGRSTATKGCSPCAPRRKQRARTGQSYYTPRIRVGHRRWALRGTHRTSRRVAARRRRFDGSDARMTTFTLPHRRRRPSQLAPLAATERTRQLAVARRAVIAIDGETSTVHASTAPWGRGRVAFPRDA